MNYEEYTEEIRGLVAAGVKGRSLYDFGRFMDSAYSYMFTEKGMIKFSPATLLVEISWDNEAVTLRFEGNGLVEFEMHNGKESAWGTCKFDRIRTFIQEFGLGKAVSKR